MWRTCPLHALPSLHWIELRTHIPPISSLRVPQLRLPLLGVALLLITLLLVALLWVPLLLLEPLVLVELSGGIHVPCLATSGPMGWHGGQGAEVKLSAHKVSVLHREAKAQQSENYKQVGLVGDDKVAPTTEMKGW